jgi:hypothetical protein
MRELDQQKRGRISRFVSDDVGPGKTAPGSPKEPKTRGAGA